MLCNLQKFTKVKSSDILLRIIICVKTMCFTDKVYLNINHSVDSHHTMYNVLVTCLHKTFVTFQYWRR